MQCDFLYQSRSDRPNATICFVHGITGDQHYTWTYKRLLSRQSLFWPAALADDFPDADILNVSYDSHLFRPNHLSLDDFTQQLIALLEEKNRSDNIIFICHSMGGLIAKNVFRLISVNPGNSTLGPVFFHYIFFATPHLGAASQFDSYAHFFRGRLTYQWLLSVNEQLSRINRDFLEYINKYNIQVECFIETLPYLPYKLNAITYYYFGFIIVERDSASLPMARNIGVYADHVDVCKLNNKTSDVYFRIKSIINNVCYSEFSRLRPI